MNFRVAFLIYTITVLFIMYILSQNLDLVYGGKKLLKYDNNAGLFSSASYSGQGNDNATVAEEYKYLVDTDNDIKNLDRHFVTFPQNKNRLGNWMFYFAATVGIARTLKYNIAIKPNHSLVNYFYISQEHVMETKLENTMALRERNWRNSTWRQKKHYLSYNLTLSSHFIAWPYFANVFEEIRKIFTIRPLYLGQALAFLNKNIPMNKTLIGIHVRRTDFRSSLAKQHGRVAANMTFFTTSMAYFRGHYRNTFFVVVSDDQIWCRKNIVGDDVVYSEFKEGIIDMAIMSSCDHAIITAGTFSWWCGWLSKGKVVYLYDFPVLGSRLDMKMIRKEYYLPDWIGVSNNGSIFVH